MQNVGILLHTSTSLDVMFSVVEKLWSNLFQIHPMLEVHYIQWIALETTEGIQIKKLKPETKPEAVFALADGEKPVAAYEYCNLHGLWKTDI